MASIFSPFLNTGQMFAVFHMAGIVLDSYAILNMTVSIGAMNGASSFKTLGVILSGPAALVGFSLLRSFSTPDTVMLMLSIFIYLQLFVGGLMSCLCYLYLFGSSLPSVVCGRAHVLFMLFVFACL